MIERVLWKPLASRQLLIPVAGMMTVVAPISFDQTSTLLQAQVMTTKASSTEKIPEWQTAAGGRKEFEVASVRMSSPGTQYGSTVNLTDGRDGAATGNFFRADAILMPYLVFAYKPFRAESRQSDLGQIA